jgi:hypothetical protein
MGYRYRYVGDHDRPVKKCPACKSSLAKEGGINLELSIEGAGNSNVATRLDDDGNLIDTPDGAVEAGFHSGTHCGSCGELLLDLDGVYEETTES